MQLLGSSTSPSPQFASVSLLLKPNSERIEVAALGEPLLIASPLATVSSACAVEALTELHTHLTHVLRSSSSAVVAEEDAFLVELLRENRNLLAGVQIFRPAVASGLGLYYLLVQDSDTSVLSTLSSLGLASHQNNTASAKIELSRLYGAVVCVGVSGLALAQSSSSIEHSMSQRMNDCIDVLATIGSKDVAAAKCTLSSFLLLEDEYKKTDAVVDGKHAIVIKDIEDAGKGVMSPMNMTRKSRRAQKPGAANSNASNELVLPITVHDNSADLARNMTDRLTLLSVAETDTFLRKYEVSAQERRANLDLTGGYKKKKFRRRKGDTRDLDFDNFDYKGPVRKERQVARAAKQATPHPETPQSAGLQIKSSKKDSSKKDSRKKVSSVPLLSASRSDAVHGTSRNRRPAGSSLQFVDDESHALTPESTSVGSTNRVQINIALNEDLACSYKESQLSSCTVEGAIQVGILTAS